MMIFLFHRRSRTFETDILLCKSNGFLFVCLCPGIYSSRITTNHYHYSDQLLTFRPKTNISQGKIEGILAFIDTNITFALNRTFLRK